MTEQQTQPPNTDAPGQQYLERLAADSFELQRCAQCERWVFFPRTICPQCGSTQLDWGPVSGNGVVYSTTIVRQRPDRGGDFNVVIVELEEHVRMMSRVTDLTPENVAIGMAVRAYIDHSGERPIVMFRSVGQVPA